MFGANLTATWVGLFAATVTAQVTVDVSAVANDPGHATVARLGAGIWRVVPIDAGQGGGFSAWHPWNGVNQGCGPTPGSCSQGWMWSCFLGLPGGASIQLKRTPDGMPVPKFATAQDAFTLGSKSFWLPLPVATDVQLWIGDSTYADNLGGVSLRFDRVPSPSFLADVGAISMRSGGVQTLAIRGGPSRAGQIYVVLGSASGSSPGLPIGRWNLPLNGPDPYLDLTLSNPNSAVLVATVGLLDQSGRATARIALPGPQPPVLAGLTVHHAVATLDGGAISGIGPAVRLDLVQ